MKKVLVLHHDDADGFGAAFAAHNAMPDCDVTFIPVQYGQDPPELALTGNYAEVFILDFSYKREVMLTLHKVNHGALLCIDHHKTAQAELEGLDFCRFNMEKSGAVLAWEYFMDFLAPPILQYVQDRDLWKFKLPYSKAVNAYIATLPNDFSVWAEFNLETATQAGEAILAFQNEQIQRRLKEVELVSLTDPRGEDYWEPFHIPCTNASDNISELGDAMCRAYPDAPFSMSYCDRKEGLRSYSLRSRFGFDVSEVARAFGGGGHAGAAGFTLPTPKVI